MSTTEHAGPRLDPTPIFELYRGYYATALLTAATSHFDLFGVLALAPLGFDALCEKLGLAPRAAMVLLVAMRAMGLVRTGASNRFELADMAREHLLPDSEFDVGRYVGLAADTPLVRDMVERLRTNKPAAAKPDEGAAYIYRDGMDSAMEHEAAARRLTLALAGRAKNVAPVLAERVPMGSNRVLLDVGGGTGIYSIACLKRYPQLRAIVWDREQVLKVAMEFAEQYGVADRMQFLPGDMFADPVPGGCDVMLLSNVLHDWDVPECRALVSRCAAGLPAGGRLLIHDVYLTDAMDGPLSVALYSAALFSLTEGRAYSAAEYRMWLGDAGLTSGEVIPTLIHCGVLPGTKG
jgi:hypothetical protein